MNFLHWLFLFVGLLLKCLEVTAMECKEPLHPGEENSIKLPNFKIQKFASSLIKIVLRLKFLKKSFIFFRYEAFHNT